LELTNEEAAALGVEVRNAAVLINCAYLKPGIGVWAKQWNFGQASDQLR
jgi:hypothetical protein